ncbi:maleylpyruvate isomerase family mycothiol-dependent enzyme [Nonomuraea antimicrobica]|uniref:Maleylpyruvate isomerase family mycothiol-dependent enzyme n=1 Tax=Nonomuraea antimicrobica TaxID=561173 RepID=A0ABP7B7K7_9ACTN
MTVLSALQAELVTATNRLLATAASLSADDLAAPSLLPGWTRRHVLAHVAGNAGSLSNLLIWARTGVRTPQYASLDARTAEIEAAAALPADRLLTGLHDGADRLAAAVRDLPAAAWSAPVEGMRPPPHPAWYVLVRRLREIGFHHVDLAAGYAPADWPDPFVRRELHDCLATWPHGHGPVSRLHFLPEPDAATFPRTAPGGNSVSFAGSGRDREVVARWTGLGDGPILRGTSRDMLAWLTGRSGGEGVSLLPVGQPFIPGPEGGRLPEPPPWLTMPAPADLPATPPEDYP